MDAAEQLVPAIMDSIVQGFRSRNLSPRTSDFQNSDLGDLIADSVSQLDPAASHTERMNQMTLSMMPIVRKVGGAGGV